MVPAGAGAARRRRSVAVVEPTARLAESVVEAIAARRRSVNKPGLGLAPVVEAIAVAVAVAIVAVAVVAVAIAIEVAARRRRARARPRPTRPPAAEPVARRRAVVRR